jgi:hypothetical protein
VTVTFPITEPLSADGALASKGNNVKTTVIVDVSYIALAVAIIVHALMH